MLELGDDQNLSLVIQELPFIERHPLFEWAMASNLVELWPPT